MVWWEPVDLVRAIKITSPGSFHVSRLAGLFFVAILAGCTDRMDSLMDEELGMDFTNVCLGRYQMDLIDTLKMSNVMYSNSDVSLYWRGLEDESEGVFYGRERHHDWLKYVHQEKGNDSYYKVVLASGIESIVGESYFYDEFNTGRKSNFLNGYFYVDFPSIEKSVNLRVRGGEDHGFYPAEDKQYKFKYEKYLNSISSYPGSLLHLPWPHNQLGVCLTSDFTLNVAKAGGEKHYRTVWWNGKNDRFEINVNVMKNKEELSENYGTAQKLLGLFASKSLDLAGRSGRLFLSDARYAKDGLEFRWVTTDAKIGSTARPYIELEGTVDMANYPKLKQVGMDARDIIVIMLKTFRVRENGLVGTS